jgi:hypothetical protein
MLRIQSENCDANRLVDAGGVKRTEGVRAALKAEERACAMRTAQLASPSLPTCARTQAYFVQPQAHKHPSQRWSVLVGFFFFWHDEKLDPEKIGTALQMGSQWTPQRTPANGIAEDPGCKGPRRPQLAARTPITPALHCTSVCGQLAVQPTAQPEARSGAAVLKMDRKINKTDSRSESKFRKSVSPVIAVQTRLVYKKTLFICFSCRLIACGRGEGSHRE